MAVFKPKSRMISFRLSKEEFRSLHQASLACGARSVSDFARDTLFHGLTAGHPDPDGLEARMNRLAAELEILNRSVERLRAAVGQPDLQLSTE